MCVFVCVCACVCVHVTVVCVHVMLDVGKQFQYPINSQFIKVNQSIFINVNSSKHHYESF